MIAARSTDAVRSEAGWRSWLLGPAPAAFLVLAASLGILAFYEIAHLTGFAFGGTSVSDYDEGVYMATGALMAHGYGLYTQIYNAQPPLFVGAIAVAYRVLGQGIWQARVVVLIFGFLAVAAVFGVGALARGWAAAAVGALLLTISPEFLVYGHAIEEEVPMMALSVASMAFLLLWIRKGSVWAAGAAGLLLGLAVLTKFFAFALLVPVVVAAAIYLWDSKSRRSDVVRFVKSGAAFVVAALLPVAASFLLFGKDEWSQMVSDRVKASSQSAGLQSASNAHMVLSFLSPDIGLVLLAVAGGLLLLLWDWRLGLVLDGWAVANLILLAGYHPLMGHHPVILLAPAAVLAGIGVSFIWPSGSMAADRPFSRGEQDHEGQAAPSSDPNTPFARRSILSPGWVRGIAVAAVLAYIILLPRLFGSYGGLLVKPGFDDRVLAAAVVKAHTPPNGLVASADPLICMDADRLCVPNLVDTSYVRIETGKLTAAEAISSVKRYRPETVAMWQRFRAVQMAPFARWVQRHYRPLKSYDCSGGSVESCDTVYIRR